MNVQELCENFLKAWKSTVRESTYIIHSKTFLLYLQPIADIEAGDLTLTVLQNHICDMRNRLKACTVSQWQNFFKRCFAYAKKTGKIERDITLELMHIPYKNKPVNVITPKQFYNLVERIKSFKNIEDLEEKILFLEILFFTGLRHSEARALQLPDFNFDENLLTVSKSIYCDYKNDYKIAQPKTRSSYRTLKIDARLAAKIKQFAEKENRGGEDFLFSYGDKNPRMANFAKWPLERACRELNLKITTHGLRHSHATFLRQKGIDIEKIQRRLGHSTILVTLRYTHAKLREEDDVIDVIEKSCYPLSRGEENERNKSDEFNI